MGLLVDGVWTEQWYDTSSTGGRFERSRAAFRNWITADGSPGPSGVGGFVAEAGRYTSMCRWLAPGPIAP
jgi:putative glutathione S-transferase